jgi:hypothetical protein
MPRQKETLGHGLISAYRSLICGYLVLMDSHDTCTIWLRLLARAENN